MKKNVIFITALLLLSVIPTQAAVSALADSAMAFVTIPVAHIRAEAAHSSEMVTQTLMGTPLKISGADGEWFEVTLPDDYTGYINSSSVVEVSPEKYAGWKRSRRVMVTAPTTVDVVADTVKGGRIAYLMAGTILAGAVPSGSDFCEVTLPDGVKGFIPAAVTMPLENVCTDHTDTDLVIETATQALGAPYLWGGTTLLAPDCSGLVRRAYFSAGILLPRDASQQAQVGVEIPLDRPDLWRRGDLLFFTNDAGTRITHVAIYDRRGRFIHSSGKVFIASIYPEDSLYIPRKVALVVRVAGCEDTPGITRLTSHPWYF